MISREGKSGVRKVKRAIFLHEWAQIPPTAYRCLIFLKIAVKYAIEEIINSGQPYRSSRQGGCLIVLEFSGNFPASPLKAEMSASVKLILKLLYCDLTLF